MDPQTSRARVESPLLEKVHEGMVVYDRDDKKVGTVDHVYLGAVGDHPIADATGPASTSTPAGVSSEYLLDENSGLGEEGFYDQVLYRMFEEDKLPREIRAKLARSGFIHVEGPFLASDRYVMPDQIASVSGDRVILRVSKDQLVKD